jgi:hypothetical protein
VSIQRNGVDRGGGAARTQCGDHNRIGLKFFWTASITRLERKREAVHGTGRANRFQGENAR